MVSEFFAFLERPFRETNVPWGTLVDQAQLIDALDRWPHSYEMRGTDRGRSVVIKNGAAGVLGFIKEQVLDAYARKITSVGGIDLQVVGIGGRGHVAFHESGIPFDGQPVLLVKLDDNTVENAIADGHFATIEDSPRYAISMSADLVYQARTVVLLANGARKTAVIYESILGPPTCDVPASRGQKFVEEGGTLIYVLDQAAAEEVLAHTHDVEKRGGAIIDMRHRPCERLQDLSFARDPATGHVR